LSSHSTNFSLSFTTLSHQKFFGVPRNTTNNRGGRATASRNEEEEEDSGPLSKEGVLSSKIIGALPIEKVESKATLSKTTVKELARELKEEKKKCPRSKMKSEGPPPIEKEELVELILKLRGDPLCSVCFEEFEEGEHVRALPCAHRFHIECVDRWLASKSIRCPMCQHPADER
jgi:E3 ubiquitin-protein ligase RNF38/44